MWIMEFYRAKDTPLLHTASRRCLINSKAARSRTPAHTHSTTNYSSGLVHTRSGVRLLPLSAGWLGLYRDMNPLLTQDEWAYEAVQEQSNGNSLKEFRQGKDKIKMHVVSLDTICNSNLYPVYQESTLIHTDPTMKLKLAFLTYVLSIGVCVVTLQSKIQFNK